MFDTGFKWNMEKPLRLIGIAIMFQAKSNKILLLMVLEVQVSKTNKY